MDASERYADRLATRHELRKAHEGAGDGVFSKASAPACGTSAATASIRSSPSRPPGWGMSGATCCWWPGTTAPTAPPRRRGRRVGELRPEDERAERAVQAGLLRCLFPYRPAALAKSRRAAVRGYAEMLYEERMFSHMPDLGGELRKAGCKARAVLAHCRTPAEHARGCWVLDLCLGNK